MTTLLLPLILKMLDKPSGPDPMMAMLIDDRKAMRERSPNAPPAAGTEKYAIRF